MSKHLNVTTGDYIVTVQDQGSIILKTGDEGAGTLGDVRIEGNLLVRGSTTTVNSVDLVVNDNIIVLNKGGTDNDGVLPNSAGERISGLEIDRGTAGPQVQWVYDENATTLFDTGSNISGAWVARDDNDVPRGIEVASITTPGVNLVLIGGGTGGPNPGVVTVEGTVDYATRVANYGDNAIPNRKYVDDRIDQVLNTAFQDTISEGTFAGAETRVEVRDNTVTGNASTVIVAISGVPKINVFENFTEIHNVRVDGNRIESIATNQDLIFTANGTGRVVVRDSFLLTKTPHSGTGVIDPVAPSDGTLLYSKAEGPGETGIYFANEAGSRDELISKNRALLYSMLF